MITASLGAGGALLSRYEGWMLALLAAVVLFFGSAIWLRQRGIFGVFGSTEFLFPTRRAWRRTSGRTSKPH